MLAESETKESVDVAGIDIGLTLLDPTSGICRTGMSGELVSHTYCDYLSRASTLGRNATFAVIAIDAPVLPPKVLHYDIRPCEKAFVWGIFQKRCKPGESHVTGTGQALRRGGAETAHQFQRHVLEADLGSPIPRVRGRHNIVESFPNGYLGVCLSEGSYVDTPGRSKKFDWLYDRWVEQGNVRRFRNMLDWNRPGFWHLVEGNRQHDERAALVCGLTAIGVLRGKYVAVGEEHCGYFFLPPWSLWNRWAKQQLEKNRRDLRLGRQVEVWIDGKSYGRGEGLPE